MKGLLYLFRRYRVATLLNLLGLGVAVATFYLFMTQVIYNRTYNHNIHDHEHMFRLEIYGNFGDVWGANVCRPFVTILKDIPQIKNVTYISPYVHDSDVKVGNRTITVPVITMGMPGIEFFTGKLLSGSSKTCADGKHNVIVNRSTAEKMFGTVNATGKTFEGENNNETKTTVTVVGVSEDMPDNCTLPNGVYIYRQCKYGWWCAAPKLCYGCSLWPLVQPRKRYTCRHKQHRGAALAKSTQPEHHNSACQLYAQPPQCRYRRANRRQAVPAYGLGWSTAWH